jgi:NitT/TauT family transport system substrate-binding protein
MKKIVSFVLTIALVFSVVAVMGGCGNNSGEKKQTLTIAYQGGIGYAPVHIMEAKKLIEKNYDGEIEVVFQKLDSGADINTGIIGGTIDVGCVGVAPAISAVANGVPAKIVSNLCSQSHGLMTSDSNIKTLKDIGNTQIALVNIGSIQHILLSMACEKELGDAHALDANIVKMAHAEGYAALESGTYKLHLTSSPFINRERENDKYTEIKAVNEIWPDGNSFLVAMASTKLQEENKVLFDAIVKSFEEAIDFINTDKQGTAEIVSGYLGQDVETTLSDLNDPTSLFFGSLKGVGEMADFMFRANFIEKEVNFEELKFSNVEGD